MTHNETLFFKLAITVEITLIMPYHGLIVCFKLKRFARSRQPKNLRQILTKVKFEENSQPVLLKKLVSYPVMIVFITDVDISSRANLSNLKQMISP